MAYDIDGFHHEVAVPGIVAAEVAFAVVHQYLVGMADDGRAVADNHLVLLAEVGPHTAAYVASKDVA